MMRSAADLGGALLGSAELGVRGAGSPLRLRLTVLTPCCCDCCPSAVLSLPPLLRAARWLPWWTLLLSTAAFAFPERCTEYCGPDCTAVPLSGCAGRAAT